MRVGNLLWSPYLWPISGIWSTFHLGDGLYLLPGWTSMMPMSQPMSYWHVFTTRCSDATNTLSRLNDVECRHCTCHYTYGMHVESEFGPEWMLQYLFEWVYRSVFFVKVSHDMIWKIFRVLATWLYLSKNICVFVQVIHVRFIVDLHLG